MGKALLETSFHAMQHKLLITGSQSTFVNKCNHDYKRRVRQPYKHGPYNRMTMLVFSVIVSVSVKEEGSSENP